MLAQSRGEIDTNIETYVACLMVMGGIRELMVQLLSNSPHLTANSTQLLDQTMAFIARTMGLPNRN